MTIEYILLLFMFIFLVLGGFIRDGGPRKTFQESAPRLGARLERDIATGADFKGEGRAPVRWQEPVERVDTGEFK